MQPRIVSYTPSGSQQVGVQEVLNNCLALARECERIIGISGRHLPPDHDTAIDCPKGLWALAAEIECTLLGVVRDVK